MNKLDLSMITLACVDTREPAEARKVIEHCKSLADFGNVAFVSIGKDCDVQIQPIKTIEEYSFIVFKLLWQVVTTPFCLIVQADGFIVNPESWSNEFLEYDYIGAPWGHRAGICGNGGFSLRSRRLMEELAKPYYNEFHPEDDRICRLYGRELEQKGFRFAPTEVAARFSWENNGFPKPPINPFGMHGIKLPK